MSIRSLVPRLVRSAPILLAFAVLGAGSSLLFGPSELVAQEPDAIARQATGTVVVDGSLDEAAWDRAPQLPTLTQREPEEGLPVSQITDVRILYDDEALLIGARLEDTGEVSNRLGRRDMALLDSDWFAVSLDSRLDRRTAYRFQTNPGGVQRDGQVTMASDGENLDLSWDAVWEVATNVDEEGWTVEMRIPFGQLRYSDVDAAIWGLQVERIIGRRGEIAHLAFVPRTEVGGVPDYSTLALEGLDRVAGGGGWEVLPYVAARGEYVDPAGNPLRSDAEHSADLGVDLRYRLGGDLTLNATVNPDFGQVEADPAVVNLGVYETFFPERRPFFVEGADIFNFTGNTSGGQLFYSRRIGRAPALSPPARFAEDPGTTPIHAAGKLSGRVGGGWAIGVLSAVTGEVDARYSDGEGEPESMVVEPLASQSVARVRRDFRGGQSAFGAAGTGVVRRMGESPVDEAFHSSAWSGGVDFRHEWADRRWSLAGSLAGSHVRGSTGAITRTQRASHHFFQRPDAEHLEVDPDATTMSGYSVGMSLDRQSGNWRGSLAGALTSPEFEVNDLGFGMRTDRRDLQALVNYRQTEPGDWFRDWTAGGGIRHEENFGGERVQRRFQLNLQGRLLNYWTLGAFAARSTRAFDDRSTRGGPLMIRPAETVVGVDVGSDPRRDVRVGLGAGLSRGEFEGRGWEVNASVDLRPSERWSLSVGPYVSRGTIDAQYLAQVENPDAGSTFGRSYLFAPLDFTHVRANIRLNATLAPRLTLETFVQPLVFAFDFGDPMALAEPASFDFVPWEGDLGPLDRTRRSLVGNAVLRWEWRPGSTLYLAWQQTRNGFGESGRFRADDDLGGLFRIPSDDILVLKVDYWLSF